MPLEAAYVGDRPVHQDRDAKTQVRKWLNSFSEVVVNM